LRVKTNGRERMKISEREKNMIEVLHENKIMKCVKIV
jgi:hypothetical protein